MTLNQQLFVAFRELVEAVRIETIARPITGEQSSLHNIGDGFRLECGGNVKIIVNRGPRGLIWSRLEAVDPRAPSVKERGALDFWDGRYILDGQQMSMAETARFFTGMLPTP